MKEMEIVSGMLGNTHCSVIARICYLCIIIPLVSLFASGFISWPVSAGELPQIFIPVSDGLDIRLLAMGSVIIALAILSIFMIGRHRRLSILLDERRDEIARLRMSLDQVEVLLKAQDSLSVFWNGGASFISDGLSDKLCVPEDMRQIMQFSIWIHADMVSCLTDRFTALVMYGETFNLNVRTRTHHLINVTGHSIGGYPILVFRDLSDNERIVESLRDNIARLKNDYTALWLVLSSVKQPVWVIAMDGQIEWVNDSYTTVAGSVTSDISNDYPRILNEQDCMDISRRLVTEQCVSDYFNGYDGCRKIQFFVVASRFGDKIVCIAQNISAIDDMRSEMQQHVQEYMRILHDCPIAVAVFDTDQRLFFYNSSYAKLWRSNDNWLSGKPLYSEILDMQRSDGYLPEQANYRSWRTQHLEMVQRGDNQDDLWHLPDGRTLSFSVQTNVLGGFTLLYEDMTEKLALEIQYNALTNVQKETIDNLNEGVALFSGDGRLRLFNPVFAQMWQFDVSQLSTSLHIDQLASLSCDSSGKTGVWGVLKRSVTGLDDERRALKIHFEGHHNRVIDCAIVPLPGGSVLATFMDVTDAARSEDALRTRNESLETIDKIRSAFIRHVSYVLRVPLNTIIGYTDLLTRDTVGTLTDKQHEFAEHILSSSHSLLAIINDILDLATLDAGAMELTYAPGDISSIMQSAANGLHDRLCAANIKIHVIEQGDLSDFMVDRKRLKQILFNLLSNAVTFSNPGGQIMLMSERRGNEVHISVVDTGKGISEDLQPSIFKPFEGYSSNPGHRGVGLGLSIVRGLVELHGGYIRVDSKPGNGTSIVCVFPISPHVSRPVSPLHPIVQDSLPLFDHWQNTSLKQDCGV